jgi:AcrR family transcriptional regulator
MTETATRRAQRRIATVAEIKAAAWADIQASGSVDCSLRAVARRLGMAPSALYRYFASREDLLTALIVDAFDDLTATLFRAHEEARRPNDRDRPVAAFVAVAAEYRRWALTDPLRYRLIFGSPVSGYVGTDDTTAASVRSSQVLLDVMVDLVAADALDTEALAGRLSTDAEQALAQWASALPTPLPPLALAVALDCYAALHGAIQLEVNGHLPPSVRDSEELFLGTMRQVLGAALR